MSDKDYESIDTSKCEDCPFYDEYGAICKMYSYNSTNIGIDMCYDACLYRKVKAVRMAVLNMADEVYCSNCARVQKQILEIIGDK